MILYFPRRCLSVRLISAAICLTIAKTTRLYEYSNSVIEIIDIVCLIYLNLRSQIDDSTSWLEFLIRQKI